MVRFPIDRQEALLEVLPALHALEAFEMPILLKCGVELFKDRLRATSTILGFLLGAFCAVGIPLKVEVLLILKSKEKLFSEVKS